MNDENQERPPHSETTIAREAWERTFGDNMTFSATANSDFKTPNTRKYQCQYENCNKCFSRRQGRSRHEKIHREKKDRLKEHLGNCECCGRISSFKDIRAAVNHRYYKRRREKLCYGDKLTAEGVWARPQCLSENKWRYNLPVGGPSRQMWIIVSTNFKIIIYWLWIFWGWWRSRLWIFWDWWRSRLVVLIYYYNYHY